MAIVANDIDVMGAYNKLIAPSLEACTCCGYEGDIVIQFKWGQRNLWEYRVGDVLKWSAGTADRPEKGIHDRGDPVVAQVKLPGAAERCPRCGSEDDREYEILIVHNRVASYRFGGWS